MKIILLPILCICFLQAHSQNNTVDLYNLKFKNIDSADINMSAFKNKHLIILEFNAATPDRDELLFLDSLYKTDTTHIGVIAVPILDFGNPSDIAALKTFLLDTLGLSYPITNIGYAKKETGSNQHILLQWITDISENGHVDNDISEEGQFYMVSSTGILYASLTSADISNVALMNFLIANEPGMP